MKSPRLHTAGIAVLAALAGLVPPTGATAQLGSVTGTVRSLADGSPVANATVTVEGTPIFARTGRNGRYHIGDVPPGTYDLTAHALGYERTTYLGHTVTAGSPDTVDFTLRPTLATADPTPAQPLQPTQAVAPDFSLRITVGLDALGGTANRPVGTGVGADLSLRHGDPRGPFVRAGPHIGTMGLDGVKNPYRLMGLYLEPGWAALGLSPRWAPFVTGRVDVARELVSATRSSFQARGIAMGGSGGALIRLGPAATFEAGLTVSAVAFNDFVFQGDAASYRCLEALATGTSLPESAIQCGTIPALVPQYNCYPPFHDQTSSECVPPKIPREATARSGTWYRVWIGVHLALADIR